MTVVTPKGRRKFWLKIIAAILLLTILTTGGFGYYKFNDLQKRVFPEKTIKLPAGGLSTPTSLALGQTPQSTGQPQGGINIPLTPTPDSQPAADFDAAKPVLSKIRAGQRVNILLLGYGGGGHQGSYLTDSMMLVSFEPKSNTAVLFSIPRDLFVPIPWRKDGTVPWYKINSAYAIGIQNEDTNFIKPEYRGPDGGALLAVQEVEEVTGINNIDAWLSMDFNGFREMVNALDGIDVNVDRAFVDTTYPANDDPDIDPSVMTISFEAGLQHLNGERALEFARSRHSAQDGTDFGRSRRQEKVLLGLKNKALKITSITHIFQVMDAISNNVRTSISYQETQDLLKYFYDHQDQFKDGTLRTIPEVIDEDKHLVFETTAVGQDALLPYGASVNPTNKNLWHDYSGIQAYIQAALLHPDLHHEGEHVLILDAAKKPEMVHELAKRLTAHGFITWVDGTSPLQNSSELIDHSNGQAPLTLAKLTQELGGLVPQTVQDKDKNSYITVVIGLDFDPTVGHQQK